ncbi:hypothetical protein JTF60_gp24 [Microbacterium phage Efeko]|uniref:Uncharacterized protein n=1 Tax=Microbacterium phage Efeko TaxID=2315704 RepID=A0A386KLP0_9CAUD|nr:hypothetical protein JTF60_gp24 [Microbacterium phage Efeko]AYD86270.1 hypothetical protein SEA_EFEKO_24 [Microbacterium phage Efeko]
MSNPLTIPETAAQLSDLVDLARHCARRARRARLFDHLNASRRVGEQMDAARTHLVTIGSSYVETASALISAGTIELGGIVGQLDRLDLGIDRIAAERTDAYDVVAFIEHHGIHLYPWQRRALEALYAA